MVARSITVSTPGRICLFGEHQDYLGLPVIAAAISLRLRLRGTIRHDDFFSVNLPDIGSQFKFAKRARVPYVIERDYFRSGYNVVRDAGICPQSGWNIEVHGEIPVNSGTSSSSALMVAWISFLLATAGDPRKEDLNFIARLAHKAEVLEFNEPGGMMDHFATAFGNVIYLDFGKDVIEVLQPDLGTFVLGDSQQPKDTKGTLAGVKQIAQEAVEMMKGRLPDFSLRTTPVEVVQDELAHLPPEHAEILLANLVDRDLLQQAHALLRQQTIDRRRLGKLFTRHHEQLRLHKKISTAKIDRMLEKAMVAGAYGGKINGSGGGGCMFAYAPEAPENVAEAVRSAGGIPFLITVDEGMRLEFACKP